MNEDKIISELRCEICSNKMSHLDLLYDSIIGPFICNYCSDAYEDEKSTIETEKMLSSFIERS